MVKPICIVVLLLFVSVGYSQEPLKLKSGEYVTHEINKRPWGTECRVTVDVNKELIDIVVPVPEKATDEDIVALVDLDVSKVASAKASAALEKQSEPASTGAATTIDKISVEKYLIDNKYLKEGQTLEDIKASVAASEEEVIK